MNWSDRETLSSPQCLDETRAPIEHNELEARPTKALIGIGVLIVLSLLMYQVNNFHSSDNGSPAQNVAQRQITPTPSPASPN